MSKTESYKLTGGDKVKQLVEQYPDYTLQTMVGYAWKGARRNTEDKNEVKATWLKGRYYPASTFEQRFEVFCTCYTAYDIDVDHDAKTIFANAFTCNDLY